jgi:three-Cys-motif partner protein
MFNLETPQDDGLITPEVGIWSTDKHHFLRRYVDAFTQAMKGKRWDGLHYIDLFAGAGIERIKDGPLEWGSSLIAAQAPVRFRQLHLCELDPAKFAALQTRVAKFSQPSPPQLIQGDANIAVRSIVDAIPSGALSLAFLDPYGLHLHFETLRVLSSRNVDLIIFFPDYLDANRNWREYYFDKPQSNLDRVLGCADWRPLLESTPRSERAAALVTLYKQQIARLGFGHFEEERVADKQDRYLYKLIFCTRAEVGAKIWRNVAMRKPGGQYTMF